MTRLFHRRRRRGGGANVWSAARSEMQGQHGNVKAVLRSHGSELCVQHLRRAAIASELSRHRRATLSSYSSWHTAVPGPRRGISSSELRGKQRRLDASGKVSLRLACLNDVEGEGSEGGLDLAQLGDLAKAGDDVLYVAGDAAQVD